MSNKLELNWIGKGKQINPEPRILIKKDELCYGEKGTGNLLIHGDNLLALKSLEQDFAGKVKCVYIDPPYNTGSAFEHYDDNLEHSTWLSLMKPRLELLRNLMAEDGSTWISIDDDESHYLKVLCDEVFGRRNFVANVIWEKKFSPQNDAKWLSDSHDHILVYAKNKETWRPNLLPRTQESLDRYRNIDNDPRGVWTSGAIQVKTPNPKDIYEIVTPSGRKVMPPKGTSWRFSRTKMDELIADNRIWFGEKGDNVPRLKRFLTDVKDGITSMTIWFRSDVGDNQEAKKEVKDVDPNDVFKTPKPERLIKRILDLASKEGDLVLDSFLGSGTTTAVAHKMGRRWIGIELGDHAYTHCKVRMDKVIDGEQGGISKAVDWKGGGGYDFYKLAPSIINIDHIGMPVISKEYNAEMLAAAMAKHENYVYDPCEKHSWKQGWFGESKTTAKNFIYTTTGTVTAEYLDGIKLEMAEGENLLICASSFTPDAKKRHKNIIVQKIPQALLGRCEFGKTYDLNVMEDITKGVADE